MLDWYGAGVAFVFGIVVGSFLNVCIYRMPAGMSIISPGSHCPSCGTALRPRDLVPLLSFLIQRCRCRYCGAAISWRYFTVEFLTGAIFALLWIFKGPNLLTAESNSDLLVPGIQFAGLAIFSAMLVAIFFIDLDHTIIPDELSVGAILLGILRDIVGIWITPPGERAGEHLLRIAVPFTSLSFPMLRSIVGMLAFGAALLIITEIGSRIYKRDAMGGGDIKLLAAFGANMAAGAVIVGFGIAVIVGSSIGILLSLLRAIRIKKRGEKMLKAALKRKKKNRELAFAAVYRTPTLSLVFPLIRRHIIPFGPMLVLGALIGQIWGLPIWEAYLRYAGLK